MYLLRLTLLIVISPVFSFTDVYVSTNLEENIRAYINVLPESLRPVNSTLFPMDLLLRHMAYNTEQRNTIEVYKGYGINYLYNIK